MWSKWLVKLAVAAGVVLILASGAMAQMLLCISAPEEKGEKTVAACSAAGEKFAFVDKSGLVRIITPDELRLTMAFNPNIGKMQAFGLKYGGRAEKIRPLMPRVEP